MKPKQPKQTKSKYYLDVDAAKIKEVNLNLRELWEHRELAWMLAKRDIKIRYKQTYIGIFWAFLKPAMTVLIFNLIFNRVARIPSENIPYPLFSLIGVSFWNFFSNSINNASNSIIGGSETIKKIYFPRIILPLTSSLVSMIDFLITIPIWIVLFIYFDYIPSWQGFALLPLLMFITFAASSGIGLMFASLNLKYRDIKQALPFFVQLGMYATPVIYPVELLKGRLYFLLISNPMAGVIENARAGFFNNKPIDWHLMGISLAISLVIFAFGLFRFKKTEKFFADII